MDLKNLWTKSSPPSDKSIRRDFTRRLDKAEKIAYSGNPEQAIQQFNSILKDQIKTLGPYDIDIWKTRFDIVAWNEK